MQQVVQSIRNGNVAVKNVPAPRAHAGEVLIANTNSVLSAGTEKMLMDFGRKSLIGKARTRPADFRRALQKVKNDGLIPTLRDVHSRLQEPLQMGYASSGIVLSCGAGVRDFRPGDRVASNGPHANVVSVPANLCARVPDGVALDHAAFTVLGAIALQGVRLADIQLGETVLVIGLGLVGQLAVALLRAAGCRVLGTDPETGRCAKALAMGAEIARPGIDAKQVAALTGGIGADAVLIAAATGSNGPITLAAGAVRQKGRVVLVGVVGLDLDRDPFFRKEAEFVVSCSYGPGRYDPEYEIKGHDYPVGHVRWTEQRNLQAVLGCMASGSLDVGPLISHRFDVGDALEAYELVSAAAEPFMGVVLRYPRDESEEPATAIRLGAARPGVARPGSAGPVGVGAAGEGTAGAGTVGVGVVGTGNFARGVLIPEIVACPEFAAVALCSKRGVTAATTGERHGFRIATTDDQKVFDDDGVGAVFVLTRHHLHAEQVIRAIERGKHVFVEKPLCITEDELERIEAALRRAGPHAPIVTVGFNRRFSRAVRLAKELFADAAGPITVSHRFNAGALPPGHWTQDPVLGGGRIIGEACHAIDTATCLVGAPPVRVFAESVGGPDAPAVADDQCFITLTHADGSIAHIAYLAGGDPAYPRERIEVVGAGRVAVIDDFRAVTAVRDGKSRTVKHRKDKGHRAEVRAFADAVANGKDVPIAWRDLRAVTLASILAVRSLHERRPIDLP